MSEFKLWTMSFIRSAEEKKAKQLEEITAVTLNHADLSRHLLASIIGTLLARESLTVKELNQIIKIYSEITKVFELIHRRQNVYVNRVDFEHFCENIRIVEEESTMNELGADMRRAYALLEVLYDDFNKIVELLGDGIDDETDIALFKSIVGSVFINSILKYCYMQLQLKYRIERSLMPNTFEKSDLEEESDVPNIYERNQNAKSETAESQSEEGWN